MLNDILLTKELNAEMFSFGPVIPKRDREGMVLKVLAISRLVDPKNAKIVVTTGFETLDPEARTLGLMAGGKFVMINVTPMKYRKIYSIYPDRAHENETIEKQIDETVELLQTAGPCSDGYGHFLQN